MENNITDISKYLTDHPWLKITDLGGVINSLFGLVFVTAVVVFFFLLLLGGIQWMTAGGKQEALQEAKSRLTTAIIGLVILFSSWAIFNLVKNFFGIEGAPGPSPVPTCQYNCTSRNLCEANDGKIVTGRCSGNQVCCQF